MICEQTETNYKIKAKPRNNSSTLNNQSNRHNPIPAKQTTNNNFDKLTRNISVMQ